MRLIELSEVQYNWGTECHGGTVKERTIEVNRGRQLSVTQARFSQIVTFYFKT